MNIEDIFVNNKKWIQEKLSSDTLFFEKLSKDQNPELLYIGCSDSRVTAEDMMGAQPGEVFVHRNVANMVIGTDLNVMTVLNFAVNRLQVKHVVVCGHYGCGGINAALQSEDMGLLNPWFRSIRDVYRLHKNVLNSITDESKKKKKLVELNVQEQCINVIKTASVQRSIKMNNLKVHGWVFDIKTGRLIDLKIDFDKILQDIMEIYKLDT